MFLWVYVCACAALYVAFWFYGFIVLSNLGENTVIQIFFYNPLFFRDSNYTSINPLEIVPQVTNIHFTLGYYFISLCLILNGFHGYNFKSTILHFCHV